MYQIEYCGVCIDLTFREVPRYPWPDSVQYGMFRFDIIIIIINYITNKPKEIHQKSRIGMVANRATNKPIPYCCHVKKTHDYQVYTSAQTQIYKRCIFLSKNWSKLISLQGVEYKIRAIYLVRLYTWTNCDSEWMSRKLKNRLIAAFLVFGAVQCWCFFKKQMLFLKYHIVLSVPSFCVDCII